MNWQADEDGMMRMFRLLPDANVVAPMSDAAFERTRRRVMRRARRLRWQHRAVQAWRLATANAWDVVLVVGVLIWMFLR